MQFQLNKEGFYFRIKRAIFILCEIKAIFFLGWGLIIQKVQSIGNEMKPDYYGFIQDCQSLTMVQIKIRFFLQVQINS